MYRMVVQLHRTCLVSDALRCSACPVLAIHGTNSVNLTYAAHMTPSYSHFLCLPIPSAICKASSTASRYAMYMRRFLSLIKPFHLMNQTMLVFSRTAAHPKRVPACWLISQVLQNTAELSHVILYSCCVVLFCYRLFRKGGVITSLDDYTSLASSTATGGGPPAQTPAGPSARLGPQIGSANVGYQLLKRAGWQEGQGLGSSQQGRSIPLAAFHQQVHQYFLRHTHTALFPAQADTAL